MAYRKSKAAKRMMSAAMGAGTLLLTKAKRGKKKKAKSNSKLTQETRQMKKQMRELKRVSEADTGLLVFRDIEASRLLASQAVQNEVSWAGCSTAELEEVLAQLRYYDPAAPTTLVTADGTTGTYQKEFYFNKIYSKLTLRNSYQTPAMVCVYALEPKADTSITPSTAWSNGLTDASNGTVNSLNIYPTDSPQFNDLWSIKKTWKRLLQAGSEMACPYSIKPFQYDPSLTDSHNLTFQRKQSFVYLIVLQGVVAHDTTLNEQSFTAAGLDRQIERTFNVKYPANADIKFTYVTSSLSSITNGLVVSSKPVADNIPYSVA